MVKTNIQTFTGEVEILSNLHVGPSGSSYLTANGAASNVLDITGNVGATFFVGDGGFLSNIATTLSDIVNQGNVSANVLQFNSTSDYAGVGLVTSSNVGIQNTAPTHTLSIGDKIRIDNNTTESAGESVMQVDGRILATRFKGDGGLLSNIATTFESIVNQGNVASNVVKFSSDSAYAGAGVITDSNVGIQNTAPTHNLSVGSNLHVNDTGSNVLTVHGNVMASNLNLGIFSITPAYGLNDVCSTSNGTTNVVQFQNGTTSLVASSNITAAGNITAQTLISTANVEITDRLKFDGNVFVDTLRVADVAANIVTYDRTTGELLDSSGTFMNKFAVVSEQPPSDLFANATTVTNHGGYTLTTSNLATNSNTFNAFDGTANAWVSGDLAGGYIGGANVFHENNLTQLSNLHPTQFGDWLAIEFPYKTTLRHMKLTPLTREQFPEKANLYATNNDLTWTEISYWKDRDPVTNSNVQTITVNSTEQFKKYAIVATQTVAASNVAIQDWQLFTESFSIDGGKVAMAQQAATGGETVMDQHGPHGRDGAAVLKKYPEIVFGSDSTKLRGNDSTNTYTQENYTVTASSQNQNPLLYSRGLTDLQGFDYGDTRSLTKDMVTATTVTIPLAYGAKEAGSALSPTGQAYHWSDWGNDVLDGWGHWYIYNTATGAASHIQFGTLNGPNGTVYTERQNHHSKMFTIKHGWVVNSIFKLDVECEDPTFSFSIGMYGNLGSDNATFQEDAQHTTSSGGTLSYNFNGNSSTGASSKSLFTHFIPKQRSFNDAITLTGNNFTTNLNTNVDTNGGQHGIWSDSLQIGATMYFVKGAVGGIEKSRSDWVAHDISGVANPWKVFDGITSRSSWASKSGTYYDGTSPANSYTGTTHQLGTGTVYGEWLKVKLSHRIKVTKLILYADVINEAPKSYKIYGSVTGSSWTELKDVSNETPSISGNSHEITDTEGYRYIAIVVTQVNTDQVNVRIGEIKLYGYDIFEGGDTSVDTTFKSIMNTPQISGAQVYVDGSLGETFTNRVVGPTVSNTHTTYVSAEKYWELSGNVESNVTLEANTFLSGDAPHSVSMWFNSSNLEANASNSCIFSLGTEERLDHVSTAFSNNYQTVQKFTAGSRSTTNANFGHSCAINSDGTRMIVGAYFEDNGATNYGAVYIYTYSDGKWDDGTRIGIPYPSSNITTDKGFGRSVDINSAGTRIVVGAHYDDEGANDAGAAYVYSYIGGTWTLDTVSGVATGRIQASDKAANDRFGNSVAMSGDGTRIIVGAIYEDTGATNAGAAYIYTYSGGSWGSEVKLQAHDASSGGDSELGWKVAMNNDGTKVIVGAPYHDLNASDGAATNAGAAYVFALSGSSWSEQAKIQATDIAAGDLFGYCVDINSDGTKIVIGAKNEATGGSAAGAVYVYTYSGGSWGTEQKIQALDKQTNSEFGHSASFNTDGTKLIVGAHHDDRVATDSGAAYIFAYDGSNWNEVVKLKAHDGAADDDFGFSVAISSDGTRIVVGADGNDDSPGTSSGSVYVYDRDTTHHLITDLKLQSNTWHNLTYAYQGEGGSRVTYLDGRKVAEDQAEDTFGDYPPFAMTGYSQGGYVVSESSFAGSAGTAPAWKAFDDLPLVTGSDITSPYWQSMTNTYETSGSYNWISGAGATGVQFTDTNSGQHSGEWIKLEMPHKLKLSYISYLCTYAAYMPKNFVILGSNDDNTWTLLKSVTNGPSTEDIYHDLAINADRFYKYYVVLTSAITGTGGEVLIANIKYYGHRENDLVRLPDPTNVLKYPHIAMTGPAQRGYVASASNETLADGNRVWHVFDENDSTFWKCDERYTSAGVENTSSGLTDTSSTAHGGEYVVLESPNKLNITGFNLTRDGTNSDTIGRSPGSIAFLGKNSAPTVTTGWTLIAQQTTSTYTNNVAPLTISGNSNYFKYHAVVIRSIDGNQLRFHIKNIELLGTEEATPVPIQIGGGNIDKVANFRVYDKFVGEDQALEIWDAQKDEFGRAKSSMTLHKGRLGIGTTEPEGRLAVADEPRYPILEEFPPRGMSSYKNFFEGHGEFCASASHQYTTSGNGSTWKVFDKTDMYGSDDSEWQTSGGTFSSGALAGSGLTTITNGIGPGVWIQLEMPYKIILKKWAIGQRTQQQSRHIKNGFLVGTNDGHKWDIIQTITSATSQTDYHHRYYDLSTNNLYHKTIRLVITEINGGDRPDINQIKFFGTREQGQSVLHDGQLTLTKSLNVPRIGPALDADDTPRRDRLVVEYNTSTNPTFEGAVRDTSGRGFDGVFYGTASYNANEKNLVTPGNASSAIVSPILKHLEGQPTLSYAFWFNQTATNGTNCMIVNLSDDGVYSTAGIGGVFLFSTGIMTNTYGGQGIQLDDALSVGTWRHVVAVCDGPSGVDNMTIYINGEKPAQSNWSSTGLVQNLVNPRLRIGGAALGTTDMFDGLISNFKLYNTALTAGEVKTLYDMGRCDEGHHVVNFSKTRVNGLISNDIVEMSEIIISNPAQPSTRGIYSNDNATRLHWAKGIHDFEWGSPGNGFFYIRYNGAERGYFHYNTGNFGQIDFTGQHRSFIDAIPQNMHSQYVGMIVCANKNKYYDLSSNTIITGNKAINVSEALPLVSLSNVALDKTCYGVISNTEYGEKKNREYEMGTFVSVSEKHEGDNRAIVNSVGEGAIWVSNIGGNLESGDYITTSNVAGYGQKQTDDVLHNYTVAKITMDCDFNPATQPVQQILRSNVIQTYYLGDVHKVKTVPHEFVTTTVGADDAWSNVSVSPSDVTYAEWSNLEANTQNTYTLTYTQTSNVVYDTKYTLTTTANVTESDPWDSVFIDPPSVTYAEYSNLEANTQSSYSLTFTKTTTDEKTPDEWSALESNTQSLYNMVYYQSVEEEVAATWPGAVAHTRVTDVIENELDEHGQIQWEDHPTETEKAYKIRYLDVSGAQTDSANAVHIAAFVGCTYHCG